MSANKEEHGDGATPFKQQKLGRIQVNSVQSIRVNGCLGADAVFFHSSYSLALF